MSETDLDLERQVRSAMEEGFSLDSSRLAAIVQTANRETQRRQVRRLVLRWRMPTLVAASLGLVVALTTMVCQPKGTADHLADVSDVIRLLSEMDGVSDECVEGTTAGELLLAWQEVPCAALPECETF